MRYESPVATIISQFLLVFLVLAAAAGGIALDRWAFREKPPLEVTTSAPAVVQRDQSVIAERKPVAKKPPKAPHKIPVTMKEERRVAVTVQPAAEECPPVRVDLSLVRDGDGRRVIASSPDGQVTGAIDIPIEPVLIEKPKPWAAGVSYDPFSDRVGMWLERDLGPRFRVGADLEQNFESGMTAQLRVGIRF